MTKDFLERDIKEEMNIELKYINEHFIDSERIRNWKPGI